MTTRVSLLVAVMAVFMAAGSAFAQQAAPAASAPPDLSPVSNPVSGFVKAGVGRYEKNMVAAAEAMPAEKYGFTPTAATFAAGQTVKYDGVRSFAEIVTHTAQANYFYFSSIGGLKPDVDTKAIGALTKKDDILKALADSFAFGHKAVAAVTPANAFESIRGLQTRAVLFAAEIGHVNDEYGQLVEYLRMNGITPPASEKK